MSIMLRTGCQKLSTGFLNGLCKAAAASNTVMVTQVALITSKSLREDRPPKPPPFDYKNKKLRFWHTFTDPAEKRFDENTRIIVVDGLPGVGKSKFAKELADELDMFHLRTFTFDDTYIDPHGFDYRCLNPKLPVDARYFDDKEFLADPTGRNSSVIQFHYYLMRYATYIDALIHLFNTGQGVVLERSPWTDYAFAKAMLTCGYMTKGGFSYYLSSLDCSLHRLRKPHLVIYLDIPAEVSKAKMEKRGRPHEVKSPALTTKYLGEIERTYKEACLPNLSQQGHVLIYDWQQEALLSDVVEDIERLDCDPQNYRREETKFADWRFATLDDVRAARGVYTNRREQLLYNCTVTRYDVPEMLISAESNAIRWEVLEELYEEHPGKRYDRGFDTENDAGILWKAWNRWEDTQPKYLKLKTE